MFILNILGFQNKNTHLMTVSMGMVKILLNPNLVSIIRMLGFTSRLHCCVKKKVIINIIVKHFLVTFPLLLVVKICLP